MLSVGIERSRSRSSEDAGGRADTCRATRRIRSAHSITHAEETSFSRCSVVLIVGIIRLVVCEGRVLNTANSSIRVRRHGLQLGLSHQIVLKRLLGMRERRVTLVSTRAADCDSRSRVSRCTNIRRQLGFSEVNRGAKVLFVLEVLKRPKIIVRRSAAGVVPSEEGFMPRVRGLVLESLLEDLLKYAWRCRMIQIRPLLCASVKPRGRGKEVEIESAILLGDTSRVPSAEYYLWHRLADGKL